MNTLQTISIINLAYTLIPVTAVLLMLWYWKQGPGNAIHAMLRMLLQLLLIGYLLGYLFASNSAYVTLCVLILMLVFPAG